MKYLFLLYRRRIIETNICFYYTRRRIIKYLFLLYRRRIIKYLFLLYKTMYNDNKHFHCTRRCIIKIFIVIIQDDV